VKEDVVPTLMRLAVTEQLKESERRYSLASDPDVEARAWSPDIARRAGEGRRALPLPYRRVSALRSGCRRKPDWRMGAGSASYKQRFSLACVGAARIIMIERDPAAEP
jgi:hypothetical protein